MIDFLLPFLQKVSKLEIYLGPGAVDHIMAVPGYCPAFMFMTDIQALGVGVLAVHCARWTLADLKFAK